MDTVLAVDIGGTKTAVGLVSAAGLVVDKETAPTPLGDPRLVVALVADLAARVEGRSGRAMGLGLSLPGVVDRGRGVLLRSPSSGWAMVPFAALLGEALGRPAVADNDVNACAWAEARFGAGRGLDSFFWLQVSTGIGGALVVGGRLVAGASAMAGEIGHLVVKAGGGACGCGNRGCLEAEAAGPAWRRRALELLEGGAGGWLAGLPREGLDARAVAAGAREGDAACLALVREVGGMLARGVAAVCCVLDPEAVIVGGGVAASLDLLMPAIREDLPSLVLAAGERRTRIVPSALGYDAALVGAAAMALFPS